ncbi:hypothetical protein H257_04482 [Aphanomyces astaci]|uniref:Uncharacterized protein n=2 Tax=Aphanomyces astaci TaxID=112090 RepID=W4GX22_APHAT|nr:hypothetical protein H257_04482 [Aphanomyces astaci]ETV83886.1 hypothetical protein H257_04482 [Aphanomyces astaci]RHY40985.1 hypothetical protein DYB34_007990 [Aphanomyces astaci]RHY92340.1 hypothetical protein DYB35_010107 [Aphanomyces astaci]RHZ05474.1 hypothetical protein DYB37_002396 [Aphanomyces astaci]RQM25222.1 hypothetical protein B5M09_000797 [Aphanomyces astaci]|eukprot:XP_009827316.1 hypothetical protein H257_04482 [Aphanomyces astaci]
MSAVPANPDAKLNDFFAKKKKKKSAVAAPVSAITHTSPALATNATVAVPQIVSPSTNGGPAIQTKGKAIAELKTAATDNGDDDDDENGETGGAASFQWSKKPKKKPVQPEADKRIAIHSERAFPTLGNAAGGAAAVAAASSGKVKPPADVRSQNVWSNIDDSDDDDK